jgi:AcrR family transcriptional regulator
MDRRAHYIETALHLFTAHGFHGVSVDEVVAEAGGSKATLYRYFRSKRELFEAIIDDLGTTTLPPDDDAIDGAPLGDALRAFGHGVAAAALSERAIVLLRLAIGEAARFPELGQALFERGPALSYTRFAALVAPRIEAGELAIDDVDVAAEQFIGGIVGHQQLRMALAVSTPTPAEIDARVEAAVASLLATYAP